MGAQSYLKSDRRITQLYGWLVAESLRIATEAGEKRNARTRRELLELALRYRAASRRVAPALNAWIGPIIRRARSMPARKAKILPLISDRIHCAEAFDRVRGARAGRARPCGAARQSADWP